MGRSRVLRRTAICVPVIVLLATGAVAAGKRGRPPGALEPSSAYAVFVLAKVASAAGMKETPAIFRAPCDAAHAVFIDGQEAIVYNPGFLDEINHRAGTSWAAVSVIAHELGHHYYGHSHQTIDAVPPEVLREHELDADYFSGYVLARMGASLDDAEAAQETLFQGAQSLTHPDSYRRLDAISAGWNDGLRDGGPAPDPSARTGLVAAREVHAGDGGDAFPRGRW